MGPPIGMNAVETSAQGALGETARLEKKKGAID